MTCNEIVKKFHTDRKNLNLNTFTNKYWYEMHLCEICSNRDGSKYESQNIIIFNQIYSCDTFMVLLNNHNKIIKVLSRENTAWIHNIRLCDKNLEILVSDFNFVKLEVRLQEVLGYEKL